MPQSRHADLNPVHDVPFGLAGPGRHTSKGAGDSRVPVKECLLARSRSPSGVQPQGWVGGAGTLPPVLCPLHIGTVDTCTPQHTPGSRMCPLLGQIPTWASSLCFPGLSLCPILILTLGTWAQCGQGAAPGTAEFPEQTQALLPSPLRAWDGDRHPKVFQQVACPLSHGWGAQGRKGLCV